jgi:hypothetical protein
MLGSARVRGSQEEGRKNHHASHHAKTLPPIIFFLRPFFQAQSHPELAGRSASEVRSVLQSGYLISFTPSSPQRLASI